MCFSNKILLLVQKKVIACSQVLYSKIFQAYNSKKSQSFTKREGGRDGQKSHKILIGYQ